MKLRDETLDSGMLIFGLVVGFAVGGVIMLFNAPRSGRATRRQFAETVESVVTPQDPVAASLAEGKAAARSAVLVTDAPERLPDGR